MIPSPPHHAVTKKEVLSSKLEGGMWSLSFQDLQGRSLEFLGHEIIGIQLQNPIGGSGSIANVSFFTKIAAEGMHNHFGPDCGGDLDGSICAFSIHQDDFIHPVNRG